MAWGDKNNQGPWGKSPPPEDGGGRRPSNDDRADLEEQIKKLKDGFYKYFRSGSGGPVNNFKALTIAAIVFFVLWLANGFYKVDPDEQAVILRFGKFNRMADSGLNYHLPSPIESVIIEKVTRVNRIEVGFRSNVFTRGRSSESGQNILEESLMLTGDENIVDINFEVQWRVSDIKDYVFNIRDQELTIKAVAESSMREIIGKTPIASALAEGRLQIELETQKLLQNILDSYKSGVQIVTLKMLKVDPPGAVIDAFRDVQTARADKERLENEAESYHNDIVPRARGEAERIVQEAEGYKKEVVARAQGEASRFIAVYEKYINARDVTKRRMYLETMEDILRGTNKIIMDNGGTKGSGVVPYLPLNELNKKSPVVTQ